MFTTDMEDSGFDSDPKQSNDMNDDDKSSCPESKVNVGETEELLDESVPKIGFKKTSPLQSRIIEKKKREGRVPHAGVIRDTQPKPGGLILPRNRLSVPGKGTSTDIRPDEQPLVTWQSESEDEFELPLTSREAHAEIREQLLKDGYNLDKLSDDEDLDLIPPRPLKERGIWCCNCSSQCPIQ